MPLKIIRNDITKMETEAIVNTANKHVAVGDGCDTAVYDAAGYWQLLEYREKYIGEVPEGEVFITPGFKLPSKYIIHAVSPRYRGGDKGEEEKLRSCYRKSLELAEQHDIKSIAFPLIATGSFRYPKEKGMRIALDEINAFLLKSDMLIYLVVFDVEGTELAKKISPDLEEYINLHYIGEKIYFASVSTPVPTAPKRQAKKSISKSISDISAAASKEKKAFYFEEQQQEELKNRVSHISDTFSQYLMYLIKSKNLKNVEVYTAALIDRKNFSKIKNNKDYQPKKFTALCLCVGAKLSLDETKDLLTRAGYALSPSDKTDIIFSYFIENQIYDMIEIDIQLEAYGLAHIIH